MKPIILLCSLVWLSLQSSLAEVLVSDDFQYSEGPLALVSEGRWRVHSGSSGPVLVAEGQAVLSQTNAEDVQISLPDYSGMQIATLYAGLRLSVRQLPSGASGSYFAHFKDSATGARCRLFATTNGASPGAIRFGLANATNKPSALWPEDLELNRKYVVVLGFDLASNQAFFSVDPAGEDSPRVEALDPASRISIAALALRQSLSAGQGMGEVAIDNLTVATTFSEAMTFQAATAMRVETGPMHLPGGFALLWKATPGLEYSVWEQDSILGSKRLLERELFFSDGQGRFEVEVGAETPERYFSVSCP